MEKAIQKKRGLAAMAMFLLLSLAPLFSKAQCPNNLVNGLPCQVDVKVEIFDWIPPNRCNPNPCAAYPLSVPPGGVIPFLCPCPTVCNVRVIVVAIGGVPVGPTTADFSTNVPPGAPIAVPPPPGIPCLPPGPGPFIHYNGADFVITP